MNSYCKLMPDFMWFVWSEIWNQTGNQSYPSLSFCVFCVLFLSSYLSPYFVLFGSQNSKFMVFQWLISHGRSRVLKLIVVLFDSESTYQDNDELLRGLGQGHRVRQMTFRGGGNFFCFIFIFKPLWLDNLMWEQFGILSEMCRILLATLLL